MSLTQLHDTLIKFTLDHPHYVLHGKLSGEENQYIPNTFWVDVLKSMEQVIFHLSSQHVFFELFIHNKWNQRETECKVIKTFILVCTK